jgi:hypothetical protein
LNNTRSRYSFTAHLAPAGVQFEPQYPETTRLINYTYLSAFRKVTDICGAFQRKTSESGVFFGKTNFSIVLFCNFDKSKNTSKSNISKGIN